MRVLRSLFQIECACACVRSLFEIGCLKVLAAKLVGKALYSLVSVIISLFLTHLLSFLRQKFFALVVCLLFEFVDISVLFLSQRLPQSWAPPL